MGGHIAYGYDDGAVDVGGPNGTTGLTHFATGTGQVTAVAVSDDGRRVAVMGSKPPPIDGTTSYPITIFDAGSGAPLARVDSQSYHADLGVFSPDGTKFAMRIEPTGSIGWQTLVLDADSGQVVLDIQASSGAPTSYAGRNVFSPDSTELAVEEGAARRSRRRRCAGENVRGSSWYGVTLVDSSGGLATMG